MFLPVDLNKQIARLVFALALLAFSSTAQAIPLTSLVVGGGGGGGSNSGTGSGGGGGGCIIIHY